jgi:cytochrome c oxidase subunit 2
LGEPISQLFWTVLIIGAVVLVGVSMALLFFAIRYRARPSAPEPVQTFGNRWLEIAWIAVPLAIVLALFGLSLNVARAVEPPTTGRAPDLIIRGHQWWWEVIYSQSGVVTANEIHLPAGRRVLAQLESADVIHDFWVPDLGRKLDAIPGQPNLLWLAADQPGTYLGACAEYCGAQHAWMRLRVIAQTEDDFNTWLQGQAQPLAASSQQAQQGALIFQQRTCANCHAVDAHAQTPSIGPNLAHLATRETIGAGVIENTPENLAAWLRDPDAIKPESLMPNLNLSEDEIQALVAYLEAQP